jgi:hypothetical protein
MASEQPVKRQPPAPPFRLTNPNPTPNVCKACGKVVKDMSRHAGSAVCATAARRALIGRLGVVEVWWRESKILTSVGVAVTVIRDQRGKRATLGAKQDKRRWYAPPPPVSALRALTAAGLTDKRIAALLQGPPDELERELAVIALSGQRLSSAAPPLGKPLVEVLTQLKDSP